jgi:hypothetical protein
MNFVNETLFCVMSDGYEPFHKYCSLTALSLILVQ